MNKIPNRCRLILITPDVSDVERMAGCVKDAMGGGDIASVIIPQYDLDIDTYQSLCSQLVPIVQDAGAAALLAGDTRIVGRSKADGIHVTGNLDELIDAMERFSPDKIVGGGNAKDRHQALSMGDCRCDYLFFGKLDGDIRPEPHRKNLALGQWWAEFVELPCVVMGGVDIKSVIDVAETGCDFVALRLAVFDDLENCAKKVEDINKLLDEKAPLFES